MHLFHVLTRRANPRAYWRDEQRTEALQNQTAWTVRFMFLRKLMPRRR
ncbi:unnamed protein product [Brassica oleracea var. botrytis]